MARRLIRARHLQHPNDPYRRIAERHQPAIAKALLQGFTKLQAHVQHVAATIGVAKADPPEPVNNPQKLFDRETVRVTIENSLNNLNDASSEAAIAALTAAGVSVAQASVISRGLQVGLAAYRAELVRQVTDDTIDAITGVIQDALNAGLNYIEIAREVKPLIGLTSQQVAAVNSFRGLLEEMDPAALERAWRDKRFDRTLQSTIDEDSNLSADQIDTMVERYAAKALKGRATTIARTESLRAANMGAKESLTQFVASRGLALTSMRQFWLTAMDELVCPVCSSIPAMNDGGVELGESFDSIDGPMDLPPDPHPNCRCTVAYRIVPDELKAWQEAADAGEPDTEAA